MREPDQRQHLVVAQAATRQPRLRSGNGMPSLSRSEPPAANNARVPGRPWSRHFALQPFPVPASPSLSGQILYVQWVQELAALRTSDALALHLF
jgi:hypothetical protein